MPEPLRVRRRRRMKEKEIRPVFEALAETFGMEMPDPDLPLEVAEHEHRLMYLRGADVIAFTEDDRLVPTLRGLLKWPATDMWVTVDMGAVKFVTNGADIMAPGITDADPDIKEGDPVWIRDETHGRPLAVGIARQSGPELKTGNKGKVVRNLHTIGDPIWEFGHLEG